MKTLQFIYEETEIHFLINPSDNNVMVNATEMAKAFDKRVRNFLRLDETQKFIEALKKSDFDSSDVSGQANIFYTTNKATFMHRKLALKFAAWLDVEFELWVFSTIDDLLFGHYKKHWQAHAIQEQAKIEKEKIKRMILTNPTAELVAQYFEEEEKEKNAGKEKTKAIKNQVKLFIPER